MRALRSPWTLLALVAAMIAALALLRGPGAPPESPEHSSDSDAATGASALKQYAAALGHDVSTEVDNFDLVPGSTLVVFSPTNAFDDQEAAEVRGWVESGGTLIYASEQVDAEDTQLETVLDLHRGAIAIPQSARPVGGLLPGVEQVSGGRQGVESLVPSGSQAPLLVAPTGQVLALRWNLGRGHLLALADPLLLSNGNLGEQDNGVLAADLLAVAPGAPVAFDEYHHFQPGTGNAFGFSTAPWSLAMIWAIAIVFGGLAWRGRAFGPRLPVQARPDRPAGEHTQAVGRLLRLSGGHDLARHLVLGSARRAVGERVGLGREAGRPDFDSLLAQRAPELAVQLSEASNPVHAGENGFVEMARRLHTLAYPIEEGSVKFPPPNLPRKGGGSLPSLPHKGGGTPGEER